MYKEAERLDWDGNAFGKMKNLKALIIRNSEIFGAPKCLPESLRVLEWHGYPSNHLPSNFHPNKPVICKLTNSSFTSFKFPGSSKASLRNIFLTL